MDPLPYRRNLRWHGYDYATPGPYFVTVCVDPRQGPVLAEVVDDQMVLTPAGLIVQHEIDAAVAALPCMRMDIARVMPDHFHMLPWLMEREAPPLGVFVNRVKSSAACRINKLRGTPGVPVFQRGYFDRVLRCPEDVERFRDYIERNPEEWIRARKTPRVR